VTSVAASLVGVQKPTHSWAPPAVSNSAREAIELCAAVGMPLDEWQQNVLTLWLGERADGTWAAFEAALIVARQNGKGGVLEARELAGLFLFGDKLIIHSAHQFDTSIEAFLRMKNLIDGSDFLRKRVKRVMNSHGDEGFELLNGARLRYKARTSGGGRGFSGDLVVLDEAQELTSRQLAALMPTLSARPNPQLVYTGTVTATAEVLRRLVDRGRAGGDERLGYAEWCAPDDADPASPETWAVANPAMGIRIDEDYIRAEWSSFTVNGTRPSPEFLQERLSIWPDVMEIGSVFPVTEWDDSSVALTDPGTDVGLSVGLAMSPDRAWSSVSMSWMSSGRKCASVERREGTDWVLPYLVDVADRRNVLSVCVDQVGPAGTMLAALGASGLPVRTLDTAAYKAACAGLVDDVRYRRFQHLAMDALEAAAARVKWRTVGDGQVFARRDSGIPIDPVEAMALAVWGLVPVKPKKEFFLANLNDLVPASDG